MQPRREDILKTMSLKCEEAEVAFPERRLEHLGRPVGVKIPLFEIEFLCDGLHITRGYMAPLGRS